MKTILTALAAAFLLAAGAEAQTTNRVQPGEVPSAADVAVLENASWLAGRWVGEGLGGTVEETWAPQAGGQMVGHFRLVQPDGSLRFYELMLLDVVDGGIRMRVKHFNPNFSGWEEKDGWHAFDPVSHTADSIEFNGLVLRRVGENEAEFVVRIRYADGVRDQVLRVRRLRSRTSQLHAKRGCWGGLRALRRRPSV